MYGSADFLNRLVLVFTSLTIFSSLLVFISFESGTNQEENFFDLKDFCANFKQMASLLSSSFSILRVKITPKKKPQHCHHTLFKVLAVGRSKASSRASHSL